MQQTRDIELSASPTTEPVEIIRFGKDELNLAEFPITSLADRVPAGQTSIQYQDRIFDEKLGKPITRKLTISAPLDEEGKPGLPTAVDDDVILGLIQLTKMVNGFTSREVEFTRLELIKLLGWPDSGDSYRRLSKSLKRWLSVTLLYENAWRDNRRGKWTTKGFHILDNIELNDTRLVTEQCELFPSKIYWNKEIFSSFESGYLKGLDYGLYLKLKHQTSKRMYRFLSKRMYFGLEVSLDLKDFAIAHIGLSKSYSGNAGKLKEKLEPAIEELEKVGFLEHTSKEDRYKKDGKNWKIRLIGKGKLPALPEGDRNEEPPAVPGLVVELVQRGVTKSTAVELVQQHPADAISAKIDVLDWLAGKKDKRVEKNPAGYLVKSIEADYAAPKGFVSRAERERLAEDARKKQQADADNRRRQQEEDARLRAGQLAINAYRKTLTPEQLREHEAEALAQADAQARSHYEETQEPVFRRMILGTLTDQYILGLLSIREPEAVDA